MSDEQLITIKTQLQQWSNNSCLVSVLLAVVGVLIVLSSANSNYPILGVLLVVVQVAIVLFFQKNQQDR